MRRVSLGLVCAALGCTTSVPPRPVPVSQPAAQSLPVGDVVTASAAPSSAPSAEPVARSPKPVASAVAADDGADPDDEAASEPAEAYQDGGIDDEEPDAPRADAAPSAAAPVPSDPLLLLSDAELKKRAKRDAASLGSLSLGAPAAGGLVNGVQMKSGPHHQLIDPGASWGTRETVDDLERVVAKIYAQHPSAPPLSIGHLSAHHGGPLSPHRSHQSGRDVDIGYYYAGGQTAWYARATKDNLDRTFSWALVRALITETDVEYIFVARSVQKLLKEHALAIGEDPAWLDSVFQYGSANPTAIIRHVQGHDTHLHVRFYNPVAEELGRRALPFLPERKLVERREEEGLAPYKVHKGETISYLARKFNTTVDAIRRANRLKSQRLVAGRTYLVPQKVVVRHARYLTASPRIAIPPRRLPPNG
jgi:murein endopeptidase